MRQNQFYAACVRAHPDRLTAFATVHPASGTATVKDEIVRASEAGFLGLGELSPHSQGFSIRDPGWQEILELAGERGLAVNLHVSDSIGKRYPGKVDTPLEDFLEMARRHPGTTFILAHWGARIPFHAQWGTEIRALQNVYYDTAASPLLYDSRVFSEMLSLVPERILFGSDYPLVLYPSREIAPAIDSFVAEVRSLGLSAEQETTVLGGNARRLFKWD
jgi:predicted TIM-barrel fold metal-dependent hydrolase